MGKGKKALVTALAAGVAIPAIVVPMSGEVKAATAESEFTHEVKSDGTVVIKSFIGSSKDVWIPETIGGKKVTEIGESAFRGANINFVNIPNGVYKIGTSAFYTSKVKEARIGDSVNDIGNWSFKDTPLGKVNIPKKIKRIGDEAFRNTLLHSNAPLVFPEGLQEIKQFAFSRSYISEVTLPKSLKEIGSWAFQESEIEKVNFPDKFDNPVIISHMAFSDNNLSGELIIPENVVRIGERAFTRANRGNGYITSVKLPNTVTRIDTEAFTKHKIETAYIPSSVVEMGKDIFKENNDFPFELTIKGDNPSKAKNYAQAYEHTFELMNDVPEVTPQPDEDVAEEGDVIKMKEGEVIEYGGRNWDVMNVDEYGSAVLISHDILQKKYKSKSASLAKHMGIYEQLSEDINEIVPNKEVHDWMKEATYELRTTGDKNALEVTGTTTNNGETAIDTKELNKTQKVGLLTLGEYNKYKNNISKVTGKYITASGSESSSRYLWGINENNEGQGVALENNSIKEELLVRPVVHLKPEYSYRDKDKNAIPLSSEEVKNLKVKNFGTMARLTWDKIENAVGYEIKRTDTGETIKVGKDENFYEDGSLVIGQQYEYTVYAVYGDDLKSDGVTIKTEDVTLPTVPGVDEPTETPEWSFADPTAPFVGVKPTITLVGGKPANDIVITNVEWVTEETVVPTPQGDVTLKPDGKGNTLVSAKDGLGDKKTATTVNVEFAGTHFMNINIKAVPVLNFNFSGK